MSTILTEDVKKEYSRDVVAGLLEEGLDYSVIADIEEDVKANFTTYMAEWAILNEGPSKLIGSGTTKLTSDEAKLAKNFTQGAVPEGWGPTGSKVSKASKASKAGLSTVAKVGIGIGLAAAAYLLYRAVRNRLDKCRKKCGKNLACVYKCRIDYQKGIITALKKNKAEFKKAGKLTPKKEAAIDKAIKKAQDKIAKYRTKMAKAK